MQRSLKRILEEINLYKPNIHYNYWEYVIKCVFAVEGHIILKIWLILRILKISSCGSLLTSNIGYGDIMIGFFSNLHIFPGKFFLYLKSTNCRMMKLS
jgi:hypothetical protein